MPKVEPAPPPTWKDCPSCEWRNYRQPGNANPTRPSVTVRPSWTFPETCGGCGAPLGDVLGRAGRTMPVEGEDGL